MEFDAKEIDDLRQQILIFVLQQLKDGAAKGDLAAVRQELGEPIAALVEAAVCRALIAQPAPPPGNALTATDLDRIAKLVARQLGQAGPVAVAPVEQQFAPDPVQSRGPIDRDAAPPRQSWSRVTGNGLIVVALAGLLAGTSIGYVLATVLAAVPAAQVGNEAVTALPDPAAAPTATRDADLKAVEGQQPLATGAVAPVATKGP